MHETPHLTTTQVATKLQVSRMTALRLITDGTLPAIKLANGSYIVSRADFDRYVAAKREEALAAIAVLDEAAS